MPDTVMEGLVGVVDEVRGIASTLGYWIKDVVAVKRTWSGARVGHGTADSLSDEDLFTIAPRPKVEDAQLRRIHDTAGLITEGSLFVSQITATLTEEEIRGVFDNENEEQVWRVERVTGGGSKFPEGPVAAAGLYRAVWFWRRPDPIGWQMLLQPLNE